ncbi:hypothetical protein FHS85_001744 [Rhodoligotrophos appendicifer]|uniref:DUF6950 family protein n=1 Tax=Rhodoligotrophos appendicifer TaxID=987056 RepID=UPI0014795A87|nr:hypothetical protein [Rhodoligotrophos appendicifer]
MRVLNWPERLFDAIRSHEARPFEWAVSDCWGMAMDVVKAMTGHEPFASARKYKSARGARGALHRRGFATIVHALAAEFEEVPPAMAQRGDLGVIEVEHEQAAAICEGVMFVAKARTGVIRVPRSHVIQAFRVP